MAKILTSSSAISSVHKQTALVKSSVSSRPPASFRPSLDLLYSLNHYTNPTGLTI